jgi:LCP family protein required for cell wall assembly
LTWFAFRLTLLVWGRGVSRFMENKQELNRSKKSAGSKQQRRKKKRALSFLSILLLLFMVGVIGVFGYTYWKITAALNTMNQGTSGNTANAAEIDDSPRPIMTGEEDDSSHAFAVAIIGTDRRSGSGGSLNTDVLMVAVIDQSKHQVHLLSIPRDTKMMAPGYSGYRKANAAFALGVNKRRQQERNDQEITETGYSVVKGMLSEYLEIPIRYHVHLGFQGFVDTVDAVNGITVDVKRSMMYDSEKDNTHINLSKGVQTLDGKNALDYVRFRLDNRGVDYQSSDFDRNKRQQEVIRAVIDKLISFEGVSNIFSVVDAVAQNTSTNLSEGKMKDLIWDFKSFSRENIFSIENEAYWDSTQGFTIIPEERLKEIQQELQKILKSE